jgi:hypothetical protein
MRVGGRYLALWSLLMATAHGAGLMALPFVLGTTAAGAHHGHQSNGMWATLVHSSGYLAVTMLIAVIVYEKVGLGVLRRMWVNVDLVWAVALILTGAITPWV